MFFFLVCVWRRATGSFSCFPHAETLAWYDNQRCLMQVQKSGERVDVMHYHVNEGRWEGKWEDGHAMYQQILQVRVSPAGKPPGTIHRFDE